MKDLVASQPAGDPPAGYDPAAVEQKWQERWRTEGTNAPDLEGGPRPYYALMMFVEFAGAVLAVKMDNADWRLLPYLFLQRFVYRQMMYYVILKSVVAALHGGAVGWNKLERRGTARVEPTG